MCGIFGYTGSNNSLPYIISGLEKLEYRGYDSAGIAYIKNGEIEIKKVVGKVQDLKNSLDFSTISNIGIGHTRWATHGGITYENAHPHVDCLKNIALVHNGIIENYKEVKKFLENKSHKFLSQTDTEVSVHLLEYLLEEEKLSLEEAIEEIFRRLEGSFAFLVMDKRRNRELFAIRRQSPLIIGYGKGENFIASDIPALGMYTDTFYFLKDNEFAKVSPEKVEIFHVTGDKSKLITINPIKIPQDNIRAEKDGYPHFMLKEIFEQPSVARRIISNLERYDNVFEIKELKESNIEWDKVQHTFIIACGTSYHAGYFAKFLWESELPFSVDIELASQIYYRSLKVPQNTLFIAISQSGETADVITAVKNLKEKGFKVLSLVNNTQSTIARESDYVIGLKAGVEIGVAATKTFIAQLIWLGLLKDYIKAKVLKENINLDNWNLLPTYLENYLDSVKNLVKNISDKYYLKRNFLYLARGKNYPLALEGALKLKEISYIHAEAVPAGEMKHGPIALLDSDTPVFGLVYKDETYSKMVNNLEEAKARKAPIIAIGNEKDEKLLNLVDDLIPMPNIDPFYYPYLAAVVLQLFAYYMANNLGREIDQPRNLAKSVTVE
uniref:Glutamine--fructose-6-phosphate aminotransferase [isomerizing] n=1 Tax=Dictyoglomus thermophilum TaxID=14 RepID=A0A7C3MJX9_DICTH